MKKFIITLISCIVPFSVAFGYDFSKIRKDLVSEYGSERLDNSKLSIIFETKGREQLKKSFDLVQIKKKLSLEMLRNFRVTDPVITAETLKRNNLDFAEVSRGGKAQIAVTNHLDSDHLMLVELSPEGKNLSLRVELVHPQTGRAASQTQYLSPEKKAATPIVAVAPKKVAPKKSASKSVLWGNKPTTFKKTAATDWVAQFGSSFTASVFREDHNESWIDLNPTAFLDPFSHSFEMSIWLKSLTDVDIPAKKFRWDWRVIDNFQVSYDLRTNEEGIHHSSYLFGKLMLVNLDKVAVSFGGRKRATWNLENPDFQQNDSTDETNDSRNSSSLFLAVTGKLENIGAYGNIYIDNQRIGVGAKFLVTEEFKAYIDSYQNYYENALIKQEAVVGVQFYNPDGSVATLRYEVDTEQFHLGLGYSF